MASILKFILWSFNAGFSLPKAREEGGIRWLIFSDFILCALLNLAGAYLYIVG